MNSVASKSIEQYRSMYHFTPSDNWLNDPNGMVFFEGEYHLFYQHHPDGLTWGPMHWGHAVSKDLVNWVHQPIALFPDEIGMIFSGSAVVDWNNTTGFFEDSPGLVAIFTHAGEDEQTKKPKQTQSLAFSKDKGRTWNKYDGNPVLINEDIIDFRDPKVFWHEATESWKMILATGDSVHIYSSKNLKEWVFASEFGKNSGSHAGVWECPDLFELPVVGLEDERYWVMIVSIGDNEHYVEGSRTQYFIGHFDGVVFTNINDEETTNWLDEGRDNYAGVTWSDVPGNEHERLFVGWMSNWKYANLTPAKTFRGAMTLPRRLFLKKYDNQVMLVQQPVDTLNKYRKEIYNVTDFQLQSSHFNIPRQDLKHYELKVEFVVENAASFGLKLCSSQHEETSITYRVADKMMCVDRSKAGKSEFHPQFACKQEFNYQLVNDILKLQVFVDASSIELFVNEGEKVVTDLIFPSEQSTAIQIFSNEGTVKVKSLHVFEIKVN